MRGSIRGRFRCAQSKERARGSRYVVRRMLAPTMGDYELVPLPRVAVPALLGNPAVSDGGAIRPSPYSRLIKQSDADVNCGESLSIVTGTTR